jgi:hypothetical protein
MRFPLSILALTLAAPAAAAPPPPPRQYVDDAAQILVSPASRDAARFASLFADNVAAFENGQLVAMGKTAWLKWHAASAAHGSQILGYSESSAGYGSAAGDLLVLETFDTVDRAELPPGFVADPRTATRSTHYEFGPDHRIHAVRIERTGGFWRSPRP